MEEQDHRRYDELYAKSHHELVLQILDAESCITADDELSQTMEQIMALQDKMIADLCREVQELEGMTSRPPRKFVPKPAYTDEDKLNILKSKLKR